ncbi:hypothetical protein [Streptomyces smyrnaeus]|uniref:hypothetical protein n=1 Tax=Streptomyces smyrnaeus TaxID=1387713 RepID=UPI0033F854B2
MELKAQRRRWTWIGAIWAVLVVTGGAVTLGLQEEPAPTFGWREMDGGSGDAVPRDGSPSFAPSSSAGHDGGCPSVPPTDPPDEEHHALDRQHQPPTGRPGARDFTTEPNSTVTDCAYVE